MSTISVKTSHPKNQEAPPLQGEPPTHAHRQATASSPPPRRSRPLCAHDGPAPTPARDAAASPNALPPICNRVRSTVGSREPRPIPHGGDASSPPAAVAEAEEDHTARILAPRSPPPWPASGPPTRSLRTFSFPASLPSSLDSPSLCAFPLPYANLLIIQA